MQAWQLSFNHYHIPNPADFAAPAPYPLSSREVEMGTHSTSQEHPPMHQDNAARWHLEASRSSEPAGLSHLHVGSAEC